MSPLFYAFAVLGLLAGLLAAIGIWSPRRLYIKAGAVTVVALFLPVTYVALAELLSRPKPLQLEWHHHDLAAADVIGADLREDEAIYLWLRIEGVVEPRAYVLPWDEHRARQLYAAQREAEAEGTAVRVRRPFEPDEEQPLFYAAPQTELPPKHTAADVLSATRR